MFKNILILNKFKIYNLIFTIYNINMKLQPVIHHPEKFVSKSFTETLETTNSGLVWMPFRSHYFYNFPTLKSARNSGGVFGFICNIADDFNLSDKVVGGVQNMSTNDYSNPDKKVRVDYVNKKTGCGGSRTNVPRKDSARVAEVETNRQ
jgi:hypothetical protein